MINQVLERVFVSVISRLLRCCDQSTTLQSRSENEETDHTTLTLTTNENTIACDGESTKQG